MTIFCMNSILLSPAFIRVFNLDEATQTARMIKALSHPAVDIVAHPTGRVLGVRPGYAVNIPEVIAAAHETNTALEINSSERLDFKR